MRKLKKIAIYFAVFLVFLIIALPFGIKHGLIYALEKQGAQHVVINSVYLNPFVGKLEIEGLQLIGKNSQGLRFDKIRIQLSISQLFYKHALIEDVLVKNLNLDVDQHANNIIIAGLPLPKPEKTKEQAPVAKNTSTPWGFGVETVRFENVKINVKSDYLDSKFAIQDLRVKTAMSWLPDYNSDITLDMKINGSPLHMIVTSELFNKSLPTRIQLKIADLQLNPLIVKQKNMPFDSLEGKLNTDLDTTFQKQKNIVSVVSKGMLSLDDLTYLSKKQDIQLGQIKWQGDVDLANVSPLSLKVWNRIKLKALDVQDNTTKIKLKNQDLTFVGGYDIKLKDKKAIVKSSTPTNITINQIDVDQEAQQLKLLSVKKIDLNELAIHNLNNIYLAKFLIDDVKLLEDLSKKNSKPVLAIGKINTHNIQYTTNKVAIDTLDLSALAANVVINDKGKLVEQEKLALLNPSSEKTKKDESAKNTKNKATSISKNKKISKEAGAKNAFQFSLNSFKLNDHSSLKFTDNSVTPVFSTNVHNIKITANSIDTADPAKTIKFTLHTNNNEYGSMDFSGNAKPFGKKLDANIKGKIQSIELVPFSAYAGKAAGINIKRGILHATINGKIKKDIMNIKNKFVLDQLTVESDNTKVSKDFLSDLPMPLDMLLDVLRDNENKITLDIPVTGNVNKPDFSLQDVYNTAMKKALKFAAVHYLTQMVQPLGLILTASNLAQMAMAPRFEPLIYKPASADLSKVNKGYLDKIGKLLKAREKLRFTLCGAAAEADWPVLQKTFKVIPKDDKNFKTKALLKLASERTRIAKDYLVKEKGIDAKRLLTCNAKIIEDSGSEKAKPQLDISL